MDLKTYSKMINDELIKRDYNLIRNTKNYNPELIGGGRVKQFIDAGNNPYDYPSTLSVGNFNPTASQRMKLEGAGATSDFFIDVGKELAKDFIKKKTGLGRTKRSYKINGGKSPLENPLISPLVDFSKDVQKTFLPNLVKKGGRKNKKGGKFFEDVKNAGVSLGKDLAKEFIMKNVKGGAVYPEYQYGGIMKPPSIKHTGSFISNLDTGFDNIFGVGDKISSTLGMGRKSKKGGVIKPIIKKRRGENVRGAVVAEVMKKMGLSLPEASKFVKQNGLY